MRYDKQLVNKEDVKVGYMISCNDGCIRSVCKNNITTGFMGYAFLVILINWDMKKLRGLSI